MAKSTVSQSCSTKVKHSFSPAFRGRGECPLYVTPPSTAEELCVDQGGKGSCGALGIVLETLLSHAPSHPSQHWGGL